MICFYTKRNYSLKLKPDKSESSNCEGIFKNLIGGQYGEMSVAMQYLFQGWSCRGEEKYKDMLMDIATEEIGHVEMLATMVARLLEGAPVEDQEAAMTKRSNNRCHYLWNESTARDRSWLRTSSC